MPINTLSQTNLQISEPIPNHFLLNSTNSNPKSFLSTSPNPNPNPSPNPKPPSPLPSSTPSLSNTTFYQIKNESSSKAISPKKHNKKEPPRTPPKKNSGSPPTDLNQRRPLPKSRKNRVPQNRRHHQYLVQRRNVSQSPSNHLQRSRLR